MITRRTLLTTGLAGCAVAAGLPAAAHDRQARPAPRALPVPQPRIVTIRDEIAPGELHVVPDVFTLYWTLPEGRAIAYAVGIGRPGLYESGEFTVGAKREWPDWTPTPGMLEREPELYEPYADGMPGGPDNPLGARALYLHRSSGRDSLLRIHGTNRPSTIGRAVSNGCARLINPQIKDLYARVPVGTRVVLYPQQVPELS